MAWTLAVPSIAGLVTHEKAIRLLVEPFGVLDLDQVQCSLRGQTPGLITLYADDNRR